MEKAEALLLVRLTPRAHRNEITRIEEGVLHVRVTSPPVESAANRALLELLAEVLDVPKVALRLSSGQRSRMKHVRIAGLTEEEVWERLKRKC